MNKEELQTYIETHIPIVKANHFIVTDISGGNVTVKGRYEDHLNHRNSVFGGSISTIMTLAAWSQVRLLMEDIGRLPLIVVKSQRVDFLKPVFTDFSAVTQEINPKEKDLFIDMFRKLGKSRLNVYADLFGEGNPESLARYTGEFVIIRNEKNGDCP